MLLINFRVKDSNSTILILVLFDMTNLPKLTISDEKVEVAEDSEDAYAQTLRRRALEFVWSSDESEEDVSSNMEDIFNTKRRDTTEQEKPVIDSRKKSDATQRRDSKQVKGKSKPKPARR